MSYTTNVPLPTQTLDQTNLPIRTNFNQLNTQFGENHVALTAAQNNGKHTHVNMIDILDPATAANEVALYSKTATLYMRKQSNGTIIQMSGPDPVAANPGQTFLPGGMIMKWGQAAIISGGAGTVVAFPVAFPTNCFVVHLTPLDPNAHYAVVLAKNQNNFTARGDAAITVQYIAIGN